MLRHERRQGSPGAVTADGEPPGVDVQVGCVGVQPVEGSDGVVRCRREWVFGCQAVVHGHHPHARPGAQAATDPLVGVEVADDEAATVEVDHRPCLASDVLGFVDPNRNVATRAWDAPILDPSNRRWVHVVDAAIEHRLSSAIRAQFAHRRYAGVFQHLQQAGGGGIGGCRDGGSGHGRDTQGVGEGVRLSHVARVSLRSRKSMGGIPRPW